MTLREAAECIGVSYRQAKRLKKKVEGEGLQGLQHGNTGKKPALAIDDDIKKRILSLSQSLYHGLNYTQISEKLLKNHQIEVSRETVRKILTSEDAPPEHIQKRLRRTKTYSLSGKEGQMVLWGGLSRRWFPEPETDCCFMAAVDMTTLRCLSARFFESETTDGYLWLLKMLISQFGIPVSFCQHSRNAVKTQRKKLTLTEELQGASVLNPVQLALCELGITHEHIPKRKAVKILQTLETMLHEEIARHSIRNIIDGNLYLQAQFVYDYNNKCTYAPQGRRQAWREPQAGLDIDRICSHYYEATVDCNNEVCVGGVRIKIPPGPQRISYAMARVEVRRLLNDTWCVYFNNRKIASYFSNPFLQPNHVLNKYYKPFRVVSTHKG